MTRRFPIYAAHADARCFRCGGALHGPRGSEYPRGSGGHRGECLACAHKGLAAFTYYDLRAAEDEQANAERAELVAQGYLPIRTCDGCLGQIDIDDPDAVVPREDERTVQSGCQYCGECTRDLRAERERGLELDRVTDNGGAS